MSSITLEALNSLPEADYVAALESLYEYSPWVVARSAAYRPHASIKSMHATLEGVIYAASVDEQKALLLAHPDLAAKIEEVASLTDFSKSEQARAGFASLPKEKIEEFRVCLASYREKFSHPFILCVTEHNAAEAVDILSTRLEMSLPSEHTACLAQVARIGWHRLNQIVAS